MSEESMSKEGETKSASDRATEAQEMVESALRRAPPAGAGVREEVEALWQCIFQQQAELLAQQQQLQALRRAQ